MEGTVLLFHRITSDPVDETANHHDMRIRTALPNKSEIVSAINALNHGKEVGLDGRFQHLFSL